MFTRFKQFFCAMGQAQKKWFSFIYVVQPLLLFIKSDALADVFKLIDRLVCSVSTDIGFGNSLVSVKKMFTKSIITKI